MAEIERQIAATNPSLISQIFVGLIGFILGIFSTVSAQLIIKKLTKKDEKRDLYKVLKTELAQNLSPIMMIKPTSKMDIVSSFCSIELTEQISNDIFTANHTKLSLLDFKQMASTNYAYQSIAKFKKYVALVEIDWNLLKTNKSINQQTFCDNLRGLTVSIHQAHYQIVEALKHLGLEAEVDKSGEIETSKLKTHFYLQVVDIITDYAAQRNGHEWLVEILLECEQKYKKS